MSLSFFTKLVTITLLAAVDASPSERRLGTRTDSTSTAIDIGSGRGIIKGGTMSWLGDNAGTSSSCGDQYTADTLLAVLGSGLHTCNASATTWVSIACNGRQVPATVVDSCETCESNEIQVQTRVYEACGYETTDRGVKTGIDFSYSS